MMEEHNPFEPMPAEDQWYWLHEALSAMIAAHLILDKEEVVGEVADMVKEQIEDRCERYVRLSKELNVPPYVRLFNPIDKEDQWFYIAKYEKLNLWEWDQAVDSSPEEFERLKELLEKTEETVKVKVYCGLYTGKADFFREPDECCYEGEAELSKEDWEDGTASMQCPVCGGILTQDMDHFELIEEKAE